MFTKHNPQTIAAPASAYAQGVEARGASRWLHVSGQIGSLPDGSLAGDSAAQMEECWRRIFEVLAGAGMDKTNIVKVTVFLTDPRDIGLYREIRDRNLDGHEAASTLLVVSGLAAPEWTMEIEAIAAA
jgi:enamine deaminase RidA (YjgF/YER057c/UK114 family)